MHRRAKWCRPPNCYGKVATLNSPQYTSELGKKLNLSVKEYPTVDSEVFFTHAGTPYLTSPGVALIARSATNLSGMASFLEGFGDSLNFGDYLNDPDILDDGAQLCKTAGQLCYASFGQKRSYNKDAARYFDNIRTSGHGSVLEHATFTFVIYGISRSVTHEIVRHRAGTAFSQISQRYVSGRVLRFVERPEYACDADLHAQFLDRIDRSAADYEATAERLLQLQKEGTELLGGEQRTDLRKKVQQAARSVLPNETEAPLVMTGNVRSWRHFIEMRASSHAEVEIRNVALLIYLCLFHCEPLLFSDYSLVLQPDGIYSVETETSKV